MFLQKNNFVRFNFTICVFVLLASLFACSSSTNGDVDEDDNGNSLSAAPLLTFSANSTAVSSGASVTLTWSSDNTSDCVASGAWGGSKLTSGSELVGPLFVDSSFILSCSGVGGDVSTSTSVDVSSVSGPGFTGSIDSSLINRSGENKVYIFFGSVVPDDVGGTGVDPIATVNVEQDHGQCTWRYLLQGLPVGEYTIAFTSEAGLDNPGADDDISFSAAANYSINTDVVQHDWQALNIITVGPGKMYATPSEAAGHVSSGDVVEIDAGVYENDIVVWRANNLVLRGVNGRAHLKSSQLIPYTSGVDTENGMGIWVFKAHNISVENIEFSGSRVPDENGAGIRIQGNDTSICNSYFHDNENGILGGGGTVIVEFSEFYDNGKSQDGQTHNLYIDGSETLIFRHNYSHHANIGHNLKTRARSNYILYNRLMDEMDGRSSYLIDVPDGGLTYIIGNSLHQGTMNDNNSLISYGAESMSSSRTHHIFVVNNTLVNDDSNGTFVSMGGSTSVSKVVNNIFVGNGAAPSGAMEYLNNLEMSAPTGFLNFSNYEYDITSSSAARNAGINPGIGGGYNLMPNYQYVHPSSRKNRTLKEGVIDIGAYEYTP